MRRSVNHRLKSAQSAVRISYHSGPHKVRKDHDWNSWSQIMDNQVFNEDGIEIDRKGGGPAGSVELGEVASAVGSAHRYQSQETGIHDAAHALCLDNRNCAEMFMCGVGSSVLPDSASSIIGHCSVRSQMTKTPVIAAQSPSNGDRSHSYPADSNKHNFAPSVPEEEQKEVQCVGIPGSQSFSGTIPRLIVTCDSRPGPTAPQAAGPGGFSPDIQPEEDSPCSDSGFGSSPIPSLLFRKLSNSSSAGLSPASSFEESEDDFVGSDMDLNIHTAAPNTLVARDEMAGKAWERLRAVLQWSPPMVSCKKRSPWVQLAGHAGSFQAGDYGKLLKRYCETEERCLQRLMGDLLRPFVPGYYGVVQRNEQDYNVMDDLLADFHSPAVMDCKMGSRTYLEEELLKARERPQLRKDMYEKMMEVDPAAPSPEEHSQQAVLKPRYMQWRETLSSTATLGFRIEGIQKADGTCNKNFKKTKQRDQVMEALRDFVDGDSQILKTYLWWLKELRIALEKSQFFRTHEVVGSSLLFVHDSTGKARVWMIDFGKTATLPPPRTLDHRTPWVEGNREDGYLWGLDNLIDIVAAMLPTA
ncbi:hypothetical protein AGOR_G00031200 [Albula goreensis]|uniref:Kinase n=1 Tax=Albula goreensis TaxID=1534307 RepID=A0A8T3E6F1_9TELE|nr:hypothetical protein AGOR_G00031200 [Albula goreensis]